MTVPRAIAPLYCDASVWRPRAAVGPAARERNAVRRIALRPGVRRRATTAMRGWRRRCTRAGSSPFRGDPNERKNWPIDELRPLSRPSPPRGATWWPRCSTGRRRRLFRPATGRRRPRSRSPAPDAALCGAARRRQHAAQAVARGPVGSARRLARRARNHAGVVGGSRRGRNHRAPAIPARRFASFAGRLDLPQLWRLFANARLLVAPDTGVAHLARVAGAPTVALFGPGSAVVTGAGDFWRNSPYRAVTVDPFPVPRPAHAVPPRNRMGAPLRAHAGAVPGASLHAGDLARRRDRRRRSNSASRCTMAARPTIVQINLAPTLGGAEVFTAFMSRALAARGWPTRVLVARRRGLLARPRLRRRGTIARARMAWRPSPRWSQATSR